jgi:hypothetical protein
LPPSKAVLPSLSFPFLSKSPKDVPARPDWWFFQVVLALIIEKSAASSRQERTFVRKPRAQRFVVLTRKVDRRSIMREPINIDKVHSIRGRVFNMKMLEGCYFFPMEQETYNLYNKDNTLLASDLKSGQDFTFNLGPFIWKVNNFKITPFQIIPALASGNWTVDVEGNLIPVPRGPHDAEDEGSFQAQAGGHLEKTAASASAY